MLGLVALNYELLIFNPASYEHDWQALINARRLTSVLYMQPGPYDSDALVPSEHPLEGRFLEVVHPPKSR